MHREGPGVTNFLPFWLQLQNLLLKHAGPLEFSVFSRLVPISTHKSLALAPLVSPLTRSSRGICTAAVPAEEEGKECYR